MARIGLLVRRTGCLDPIETPRFALAGTFKTPDFEIQIRPNGPVAQPDRAAVS
jgi:hypothetical protein